MDKIFNRIVLYIGVFLGLIALYVLLLTLTFSYWASDNIMHKCAYAFQIFDTEGAHPAFGYTEGGAWLDNYTDRVMISKMQKDPDESPIYQAMDQGGYGRYWHGYLVWLRPVSLFLNLSQLRLLISAIAFGSFLTSTILLYKKFGIGAAVSLAVTWFVCFSTVTIMSLQFASSGITMELALIFMLVFYERIKEKYLPLFFLIIGSLINFLDFLTYPIVTLTLPLIAIMLFMDRDGVSLRERFWVIIKSSLAWGLGYGFTWIAKWVVGTAITGNNILKEGIEASVIRSVGEGDLPGNRLQVLKYNIDVPYLYKYLCVACILVLIYTLLRKRYDRVSNCIPLMIIWLFPYGWYEVFFQHSLYHTFFTFRSQMGSIFIVTVIMFMCLRKNRGEISKK